MTYLVVILLMIGMIVLGSITKQRFYNLIATVLSLYMLFENLGIFFIIAFLGLAIMQFYITFFGKIGRAHV